MRDLPVVLDGHRLTVVEPPAVKTRMDKQGKEVEATDREGARLFVVSLFAKRRAEAGQRVPKGEEIKVTLATDPGMGFEEDARVELIGPTVSYYEMTNDGRTTSGLAWAATGIKHAGATGGRSSRGKDKDVASEGEPS